MRGRSRNNADTLENNTQVSSPGREAPEQGCKRCTQETCARHSGPGGTGRASTRTCGEKIEAKVGNFVPIYTREPRSTRKRISRARPHPTTQVTDNVVVKSYLWIVCDDCNLEQTVQRRNYAILLEAEPVPKV